MKKVRQGGRANGRQSTRRKQGPESIDDEEEEILRAATIHLIRKHGGLLVATGAREERSEVGSPRWIIAVTLRYPTGHEGYVGDLLYDGKEFAFLTPPEVINQRVEQIAADPERQRKWDEYRASTLPPGEG